MRYKIVTHCERILGKDWYSILDTIENKKIDISKIGDKYNLIFAIYDHTSRLDDLKLLERCLNEKEFDKEFLNYVKGDESGK